MSTPCANVDDIINRQALALKNTILEAKQNEKTRIRKLTEATSREREAELNKRYELERQRDEMRITNLMEDLERVKVGAAKGELSVCPKGSRVISNPNMNANRFAGCENANDLKFLKEVTTNFQKYDEKFNRKLGVNKFEYYVEKKKCNLLAEKRDVLKQLVDMHTQELSDHGVILGANGFYNGSRNNRGNSDTRSVSSDSSSASWASFHTENNNIHRHARAAPRAVPKLKLK
jgi:hypothetical protein